MPERNAGRPSVLSGRTASSSTRSSPRRRTRTAILALATGLALTGCSSPSDPASAASAPDDGVPLELGPLLLSNLMVLSTAEGAAGTVLGAISNGGRRDVELYIGLTAQTHATISVPAGETILLGTQDRPVVLESVPAPPGALVELSLSTARGFWATQEVPVLDGTFERYDGLVPRLAD